MQFSVIIYAFDKTFNLPESIKKRFFLMDKKNSTTLLVMTALLTAMAVVATLFFKVPIGPGYIHLGDVVVILAAFLLPRKYACFAGAVGASLADIIGGYAIWAPWTFAIKLCMVLIMAASLSASAAKAEKNGSVPSFVFGVREVIYMIACTVLSVGGYYIAEWVIYGNAKAPMLGVPFNALQTAGGCVVAALLAKALLRTPLKVMIADARKN